ncbi:MAG: hypothetical protein ACPG7F_08835 [Aggregatilineales bacterium]
MSKRKKHQHRLSEINVVSSLDIEAVASEIAALENKQIRVVFDEIDADHTGFMIGYLRDGEVTASVKGVMRRWAGTMTHIICDGHARHKRPLIKRLYKFIEYLAAGWLTAVIAIQLPLILSVSSGDATFIRLFTLLMFVGLLLAPAYYITRILARMAGEGVNYIRDRERLLQGIVDVLAPNHQETAAMRLKETDSPSELSLSDMVRLAYEPGIDLIEDMI